MKVLPSGPVVILLLISSLVIGDGSVVASEPEEPPSFDIQVKFTFGPSGSPRPATFIVGEAPVATFCASGLQSRPDGKMAYTIQSELRDEQGQLLTLLDGQHLNYHLPFGGGTFTHSAPLPIPQNFVPGKYRYVVLATDLVTGQKVTQEVPFEMQAPTTFGAIGLYLAHDANGACPAGASFGAGQTAFVRYGLVGYRCLAGRMHVINELTVADEAGKPIGSAPIVVTAERNVPDGQDGVVTTPLPVMLHVPVNRDGRFQIMLKIADVLADSQVSYAIPIVVSPALDAASK